MRFAIFGSGGLGCLFGGVLTRAGVDVTLIARGANLAALRERGLEVRFLSGERFHVDVRATGDPGEVGPVDADGAGAFCDPTWPVVLFGRRSWDPLWSPQVPLCLAAPTVPAARSSTWLAVTRASASPSSPDTVSGRAFVWR